MNIQGAKMSNGMDLVFAYMEEDLENNSVFLKKCVAIHITQSSDGKPNMGFLPLSFFSKGAKDGMDVTISKSHVLFFYEVNEDIARGFGEFASGLSIPKKPGIIL